MFQRALRQWVVAIGFLAAFAGVSIFAERLSAQSPNAQDKTRPRTTSEVQSPTPTPPPRPGDVLENDDVIRVETSLTNIFFTAADNNKRFVSNLTKEQIRVFEDGQPQEIFTFQQNIDLPLSVAILIDTSQSEERTLPDEKAAARAFLESIMRPARMKLRLFHSPERSPLSRGLREILIACEEPSSALSSSPRLVTSAVA